MYVECCTRCDVRCMLYNVWCAVYKVLQFSSFGHRVDAHLCPSAPEAMLRASALFLHCRQEEHTVGKVAGRLRRSLRSWTKRPSSVLTLKNAWPGLTQNGYRRDACTRVDGFTVMHHSGGWLRIDIFRCLGVGYHALLYTVFLTGGWLYYSRLDGAYGCAVLFSGFSGHVS